MRGGWFEIYATLNFALRVVTLCFLLAVGFTQVYANVRTFGSFGFILLMVATPCISLVLWLARIWLREKDAGAP